MDMVATSEGDEGKTSKQCHTVDTEAN